METLRRARGHFDSTPKTETRDIVNDGDDTSVLPRIPPEEGIATSGETMPTQEEIDSEEEDRKAGNQWFKDNPTITKREVAEFLGIPAREACRFFRNELARGEVGRKRALIIRSGMRKIIEKGFKKRKPSEETEDEASEDDKPVKRQRTQSPPRTNDMIGQMKKGMKATLPDGTVIEYM
jgi:hypothetical protein